ncbi:MAG TPA: RNA polymerase sigma-54 factor, partial [Treponemataceae bacterium]|nr:RNA polymerase sigma-54 factor [Treponemataceae bacterium]
MVQSIRLMAMPFAEMRERIMEEVETNPALEIIRDPVMQPPRNFEQFTPATTYVQAGSDDESDEHRNFIEGVLHHNAT